MTRNARIAASPLARRLAQESGLSLEALRGSGPGGRIVAADVRAQGPAANAAPAVVSDPAPAGPGTAAGGALSHYAFDAPLSALEAISIQLATPAISVADARVTLLMMAAVRALTAAPQGAPALLAYQATDRRRGPVAPAALRGWTDARLALREARDATAAADFTVFDLAGTPVTHAFAPTSSACLTIGRIAADGRAAMGMTLDAATTPFPQAITLINALCDAIAAPARLLID